MNPGDWCVYIADKETYDEYKIEQEKVKAKEQAEKEPRGRGGMFERHARAAERTEEKDEVKTQTVMDIEPLSMMVAVGFTHKEFNPGSNREVSGYDTTLKIQNRLNRKKSTDSEIPSTANTRGRR